MNLRMMLAALFATMLSLSSAQAADSPTLRKIRAAGMISIGYRESSMPFSYLDGAQRPVGYSIAICDHIVEAVKAKLGVRDLERRYVPVTAATRMSMVTNGAVDMECGVTTNTLQRQRQVAFSVTTFVAASRFVSKKSSPLRRVEDLRGKVVTSTVGTTSLRHLQDLDANGINMRIFAARDDADAFRMVETDRAAAYAMDDVLLTATIANSHSPGNYVISDEKLSVEPYGIMLNKGDAEFKRLADRVIIALFKSGEINELYRQWFLSPIPPKGINLAMPMSTIMNRLAEHPTDSPDPATYR